MAMTGVRSSASTVESTMKARTGLYWDERAAQTRAAGAEHEGGQ